MTLVIDNPSRIDDWKPRYYMMTLYKPWIEKSREERFLQNSCDIELTKANTR